MLTLAMPMDTLVQPDHDSEPTWNLMPALLIRESIYAGAHLRNGSCVLSSNER